MTNEENFQRYIKKITKIILGLFLCMPLMIISFGIAMVFYLTGELYEEDNYE